MTGSTQKHLCLICAGLMLVLGLCAMLRFWHPVYGFTPLIQLDPSNDELKVPAFKEHPVYVHQGKGGYDGLYYAQLATDPTLRDPSLRQAMDNFPYRARRMLMPALAWLLGGGRADWVVNVYAGLNIVFWLTLGLLLWRWLPVRDGRSLLAWSGLLFSAGAIGSFRFALSDLPSMTLLAAGLFAAEKGRPRGALTCLGLAALARETSVLGLAGLTWPRKDAEGRRQTPPLKWVLGVACAVGPLALWLAYVRMQAGPGDQGWSNFRVPFSGCVEKARACVEDVLHLGDPKLALSTLLSFVGLSAQLVYVAVRRQWSDPWWRLGAVFAAVALLAGTPVWEGHPGAITRVALPLQLACCVLMVRGRASFAWLALANLGVFSGLLFLSEVPRRETELAADRTGAAAAVLEVGKGWYPIEQSKGKRWVWAEKSAAFEIEAWPKSTAHHARVVLPMRAISERDIVVRQKGKVLATFRIGLIPQDFVLETVEVQSARVVLELSSTSEPVATQGRPLGFCVAGPQIETID